MCERDSGYTCMPVINCQKKVKSLSSIQVKKEQSAAIIQMVWNGGGSKHDFYETTSIFYERDDFSVSNRRDSEESQFSKRPI